MISTIEKVLFLKSVKLFDEIPSEDLARVAQIAHEMNFDKAETFIKQGDIGDCLYIIIDGKVNIVVDGVGQVAQLGAKQVVGDMAILSSEPRSANCIADNEIVALRIDRDDFWDLMSEKPEIALGIIKVLIHRLNDANKKLQKAK